MYLKTAIAVLSAAAIAYEILLIRILSVIQWYHFAAMIISLALLGYGMSGTVLTLLEDWLTAGPPHRWYRIFIGGCLLFGLLSVSCAVLAQRIPFNPLALVWDPRQVLGLLGIYLLLAAPFFCAATAIGVALMSQPEGVGGLYGADLAGAGVGAAVLLAGLFLLPVSVCLRIVGILGCLAAGAFVLGHRHQQFSRTSTLPPLAVLTLLIFWPQGCLELRLSEYKALSKTLLIPGAEIVAERSSPLGLLTLVGNSEVPFRHAPGLSLNFAQRLPEQLGLFTDGDSMTAVNLLRPGEPDLEHLDYLPSAVGYRLVEQPSVLILGAAGGGEIQMAARNRAERIEVVEANRQQVDLLGAATYVDGRGLLERGNATLHAVDARSFLRQNESRFGLIQIPLAQSLASATAGSQALGANHLLTVESFVELLNHLEPEGVLVLSYWLKVPPRENLKLTASLARALTLLGVAETDRHLAQIRGWGTVTTLVKKTVLSPSDIEEVLRFCRERSFDVTMLPGLTEDSSNVYNRLEEAYFYQSNKEILRDPDRFFASYKFDVRPATDDRPFFFHTFKWRTLPELLRLAGRAGIPLVEWGYLTLVATVIQAILASVLLILLPLRLVRRRATTRASLTVLVFFASLGLGFMLLELAFFERFTLYLGHPTYSMAMVLAGFLISAGIGSSVSRRLSHRQSRVRLDTWRMTMAVLAVGGLYWIGLPHLMRGTLALPILPKLGLTFAMLAPLGFLMGMPFPLGLTRAAARRSIWLPWAWGINGSASVIGAALAPLIAVHLGVSAVQLAGLCFYGLASLCTLRRSPGSGFGIERE